MITRSSPAVGFGNGDPDTKDGDETRAGKRRTRRKDRDKKDRDKKDATKRRARKKDRDKKDATKRRARKKDRGTGGVREATSESPPETVRLTFVLAGEAAEGHVSVLGDFNRWDPLAHPLERQSDGTRSASVDLPVGATVAFKYLDESGRWFCDPDHPETRVNEYGETDSVVTI